MNNIHLLCTGHGGITFALATAKNRKNLPFYLKMVIQSRILARALLRSREESITKRRSRALDIRLLSVGKI